MQKGGETGEGLKEIEEKPYAEVYVEGPMAPLLFDLTRFSVREVEEQLLIAVKDGYQKEEAADAFFLDNNTQNVRVRMSVTMDSKRICSSEAFLYGRAYLSMQGLQEAHSWYSGSSHEPVLSFFCARVQ